MPFGPRVYHHLPLDDCIRSMHDSSMVIQEPTSMAACITTCFTRSCAPLFQSSLIRGFIWDFISDNMGSANVHIPNLLFLCPRCTEPCTAPVVLLSRPPIHRSDWKRVCLLRSSEHHTMQAQVCTFYLRSLLSHHELLSTM